MGTCAPIQIEPKWKAQVSGFILLSFPLASLRWPGQQVANVFNFDKNVNRL